MQGDLLQKLKSWKYAGRYLKKAHKSGDVEAYKIAIANVRAVWASKIPQARDREQVARYLLLHPEVIPAEEDRDAIEEYVREETWKGMYRHDHLMYRMLRKAVDRYIESRGIPMIRHNFENPGDSWSLGHLQEKGAILFQLGDKDGDQARVRIAPEEAENLAIELKLAAKEARRLMKLPRPSSKSPSK